MPLIPQAMPYVCGSHFCDPEGKIKLNFLEHINSVDPAIKFTVEDTRQDGAIFFLETLVKPEADNTLFITVFRKSIHTD